MLRPLTGFRARKTRSIRTGPSKRIAVGGYPKNLDIDLCEIAGKGFFAGAASFPDFFKSEFIYRQKAPRASRGEETFRTTETDEQRFELRHMAFARTFRMSRGFPAPNLYENHPHYPQETEKKLPGFDEPGTFEARTKNRAFYNILAFTELTIQEQAFEFLYAIEENLLSRKAAEKVLGSGVLHRIGRWLAQMRVVVCEIVFTPTWTDPIDKTWHKKLHRSMKVLDWGLLNRDAVLELINRSQRPRVVDFMWVSAAGFQDANLMAEVARRVIWREEEMRRDFPDRDPIPKTDREFAEDHFGYPRGNQIYTGPKRRASKVHTAQTFASRLESELAMRKKVREITKPAIVRMQNGRYVQKKISPKTAPDLLKDLEQIVWEANEAKAKKTREREQKRMRERQKEKAQKKAARKAKP